MARRNPCNGIQIYRQKALYTDAYKKNMDQISSIKTLWASAFFSYQYGEKRKSGCDSAAERTRRPPGTADTVKVFATNHRDKQSRSRFNRLPFPSYLVD